MRYGDIMTQSMNYQELKEYHIFEAKLHDFKPKDDFPFDLLEFWVIESYTKDESYIRIFINEDTITIDPISIINDTYYPDDRYTILLLDFNDIITHG